MLECVTPPRAARSNARTGIGLEPDIPSGQKGDSDMANSAKVLVCLMIAAGGIAAGAGEARAQSVSVSISFQPATFPLQTGFIGDFGLTFGARGNGFSYGWNVSHTSRTFSYSPLPGWESVWGAQWSVIRMITGSSTTWEIAVPNGSYDISILAAGYQCQGTLQQIAAEGTLVVNATPGWDYDTWVGGSATIAVTDGRLTLSNGPSTILNCIDSIVIHTH
jgi:hypothetical protein